jgi:hypothetical protein
MLKNLSPPKTMYTPAQAVPHLFGLESGEGGMCLYYLWYLIHDVKEYNLLLVRFIIKCIIYIVCAWHVK